jgi:hypothetical protein
VIVHPVAVFWYDVALAAGYMVVLVFTWITTQGASGLSMLAAYATMPLLANLYVNQRPRSTVLGLTEGLAG